MVDLAWAVTKIQRIERFRISIPKVTFLLTLVLLIVKLVGQNIWVTRMEMSVTAPNRTITFFVTARNPIAKMEKVEVGH